MTFRIFCLLLSVLWPALLSANNSVLSSGAWYKMAVSSTGMYKLTYSDLSAMGLDVNILDPRNIHVYHNGGGILPKLNSGYYPDDLAEIPIYVYGEEDGVFNQNDYVVFYARVLLSGIITKTGECTLTSKIHIPTILMRSLLLMTRRD